MEIYNKFLKNNGQFEVTFVETSNPITTFDLWYMRFKNNFKPDGFYIKTLSMYDLEKHNDVLLDYTRSIRHYHFVKIIKDDVNPNLEGEVMLYYFGYKIKMIIDNWLTGNQKKSMYDNTFIINKGSVGVGNNRFSKFDKSHFTEKSQPYKDLTLDVKSFVYFNSVDIDSLKTKNERKKKLLELKKNENLKQNLGNLLPDKGSDTIDKIIDEFSKL